MISEYRNNNITWIDVQKPTKQEVLHLMEEYNLPELVADEMVQKTLRGKVDFYEKQKLIYAVLHFPTIMQNGDKAHNEIEIDFVIGRDFIITAHSEDILSLQDFARIFDTDSVLSKVDLGDHAGFFFFHMAKRLYKSSLDQLEHIDQELEEIEDQVFENKEEQMVRKISELNRRLLDFKQAINTHEEVLRSFEQAANTLFGDSFKYYISDISGEYRRVRSVLESHKDVLRDLKETNDALLTNKINTVMKALTIMSFIMLPLTLITGVFGMNTGLKLSIDDFYMIIGAMTATGIVMFIYFRGKGWF